MKRYLSLLAMAALLFAACKPEELPDNSGNNGNNKEPEGEAPAPELILTSNPNMEFELQGGNANILFAIRNPVEGETVTAECEAEWVTDLTAEAKKVSFFVQPNETESERTTKIVVSYQELSFEVSVSQKAPEPKAIEFTAITLTGKYYETNYTDDTYSYLVKLSDKELTSNGQPAAGSAVFIFDLYSTIAAEKGETCRVPEGEYVFDEAFTYATGTFADLSSYVVLVDEYGVRTEALYTAGSVVVSENKFEATITVQGGQAYHIVYEGPIEIEGTGVEEERQPVSSLTEDLTVSSENGLMEVIFDSNWYGMEVDSYTISLYDNRETLSGHSFKLDLLTPLEVGMDGTYISIKGDEDGDYHYYPGDYKIKDGVLTAYNSWYMSVTEGEEDGNSYAPLVDGTVTISNNEDGTYTVVFDMYDDLGHKISGTITATANIYDTEGNPMNAMQKSSSAGQKPTSIKKALKPIKAPLTFISK